MKIYGRTPALCRGYTCLRFGGVLSTANVLLRLRALDARGHGVKGLSLLLSGTGANLLVLGHPVRCKTAAADGARRQAVILAGGG